MQIRTLAASAGVVLALLGTPSSVHGQKQPAVHRTPNFVVHAETPEIARQVGTLAEHYRDRLAEAWLGKTLPRWYQPCRVTVKTGRLGAGGATTFHFNRGEVYGWRMEVQGSLERVLDSVLPHEVSHTIFATHFRRPLPRWADEGAATLVEHESERNRQTKLLGEVIRSGERFPLRQLLAMTEYPSGHRRVLTMYAQGYSLADYLVQQGGRTRFLHFLDDADRQGWNQALAEHYEIDGVDRLESAWSEWFAAGSPAISRDVRLADLVAPGAPPSEAASTAGSALAGAVVRGQSPDTVPAEQTDAPLFQAGRSRADAASKPAPPSSRDAWVKTDPRRERPDPLGAFHQPLRR